MHAVALKLARSMAGPVTPCLVAGAIYFVTAFTTDASAVASITGGIVVAAIAVATGLIVRAAYRPMSKKPQVR